MYHLFIDNDKHKFDPGSNVQLDYLLYQNASTGILINLKQHVRLTDHPQRQITVQVGKVDAYRFHPNDIDAIVADSGGFDWDSPRLEPFHLECHLRLAIKYPDTNLIALNGERFMDRIPLAAYGITSHTTNYDEEENG